MLVSQISRFTSRGIASLFQNRFGTSMSEAAEQRNSVIVMNIPYKATRQQVFFHMKRAGYITKTRLIEKNGRFSGKAVIEFQTPEAAMTAIETLNNSLIEVDGQERQIVVLPDRSERVAFPVFEPEFEGRVLFVKNIPSNHPESKDALLAAAPNATAVNPVTNRSFVVVFETVGEAQDAISRISSISIEGVQPLVSEYRSYRKDVKSPSYEEN